ncbi:hypothetical protein RIF29_24497 [Crotalaria pallida]|uniref:Uncharacterized protein n=1 Tax=Crotalaria pallida TaxID=3830 RepID=A0AAN9HWP0_CROPI
MEIQENQPESLVSNKTSNSSKKKNARFKDEEELVEIVVQNINGGGDSADRVQLKKSKTMGYSSRKFDRTKSGAAPALKGLEFVTSFRAEGWSVVKDRFEKLAAADNKLPRALFGECIGMNNKEFDGELFDALARRGGITSASITKDQLREFWEQITDDSFDSRLRIFFDMVDKNADGRITVEEVKEIIALSASANKLSKIQERAEEYAAFIVEEFDRDKHGFIELCDLEKLLVQALPQATHLSTNNKVLTKIMSKKSDSTEEDNPIKQGFLALAYFVKDNWKRLWVITLWLFICIALFTWKFIQYKHHAVFHVMGYCVTTAKGAAETLKFNMALILLPVCRNTITWLRTRTMVGEVVPFDDNTNFHKTWMYVAVPMMIYACERLLRTFRSGYKRVDILKVAVYPDLLALHMSKPKRFKYSSGQYIFVKCLGVSPFEWHPFSLTSAPGDDYVSVHIKALGDWTSQLKAVFAKACKPASGDQSGILYVDMLQDKNNKKLKMPKVLIDGPYGAPAQDYKSYEIIILVGLGIGATPMISILKDVLNNIKHKKDIEEGVVESGFKNNKRKTFATNQAYFYWVTREQGSFEWFKSVMDEVAENDKDGVIELHNHCTSVYKEEDVRCALISMLQSLHYAKSGMDIVSGTRVKTHFGKPTWPSVFKHVALKHPGKRVGVFFCGAQGFEELERLCHEFTRSTHTRFDFHKENF